MYKIHWKQKATENIFEVKTGKFQSEYDPSLYGDVMLLSLQNIPNIYLRKEEIICIFFSLAHFIHQLSTYTCFG